MKTKKMSEKKRAKKAREEIKGDIADNTIKINVKDKPLSKEILQKMNAYWRAANYLSVGRFISTTIRC